MDILLNWTESPSPTCEEEIRSTERGQRSKRLENISHDRVTQTLERKTLRLSVCRRKHVEDGIKISPSGNVPSSPAPQQLQRELSSLIAFKSYTSMALMLDMDVNVSFERRHAHGDAVPTGLPLEGRRGALLRHGWMNRSKWHHIILIMSVQTQTLELYTPQLARL